MIQIDIDADLNMVDDDDRNFARRPKDVSRLAVGRVAVAGRPGFWSWVMIDDVGDTAVYFHQISDAEAAALRSGDAAYSAVTESGTLLRYEPSLSVMRPRSSLSSCRSRRRKARTSPKQHSRRPSSSCSRGRRTSTCRLRARLRWRRTFGRSWRR